MPTFYEVLGIEKAASQEDVRKAYRRRALETHPDKMPLTTEGVKESAAARFRDVHEAFQVLNNPYQRRAYDISINARPDLPKSEKSWEQLDEEQIARMKDREEWAKQAAQRRQERLSALGEARKARDAERKARLEKKGFNYEALMDRMLEDLCKLNPEWQARKEQAQRRKAEQDQRGT